MPTKNRTLLGLVLLAILNFAAWGQEQARPNILILLADDLRHDAVGFAGNPLVQTPHLDRLARESTVFTNAFVTTAICSVSRASIFSGQYARRHGIYDFATSFTEKQWAQCYPEQLERNGYRVGFIGKFGVGNRAPTNTFDYWDGFNGQGRYLPQNNTSHQPHLTARMGDSALRFLREKDSRPFCLSISFKAPHAQDGEAREFPPDPRDETVYGDLHYPAAPNVSEEAFARLPLFLQKSEGRNRWQRRFANQDMRNRTIRDYLRLVTGIDREVGRIRDALAAAGHTNTVIIFTSDNGFYYGEHGLADKWFMHEESIRIPFMVFHPAQPSGRTLQQIVLNIDVAPTVLHCAGITPPGTMQGQSLKPLLLGTQPAGWREDFFYEHHFDYGGKIPDSEGVRERRWKYIRYTGVSPVVEQLYDLERDPHELSNLANDEKHSATIARLRSRWDELQRSLK